MAEPTPPSPERAGDPLPQDGGDGHGRKKRRWPRWLGRGILGLLALVAGALAVLNWAPPGQELVVDTILSRAEGAFAGPLTVEDVHSPGLLGGATLVGVRLETGDGRTFLTADSIRARWTLSGLLLGDPALSSVTAWGARIEVSKYTEDQPMTVERLLAESEPAADSAGGGPTRIGLGRVRLVDALVEVLTPAPPGDTLSTVPSPVGDGRLSRLALEEMEVELDRTVLSLGGGEPLSAYLAHMSMDVTFLPRPIELVGAEGPLTFGPRGLTVSDGHFRFPGTVMAGTVELGPQVTQGDAWAFGADLSTDGPGSLEDLRWIDPRVPDGSFRGDVAVTVGEQVEVSLGQARISLEASDLLLDGGLRIVDEELRLDGLAIEASPVVVDRLEPWVGQELPLDGFLTGRVTLDGPLTALRTDGRVTLAPEGVAGGPTTADLDGILHLGEDPGVTNLEMRLDPLNFGLAEAVQAGMMPQGAGRAVLNASGRLDRGIRFVADVTHGTDSLASRAVARGTVQRTEGRVSLDVLTDLSPFSLDLLARVLPEAGLEGRVRGSIRTVGSLDSLRVEGRIEAGGGRATVDATLDVTDPASRYDLAAELEEMELSDLSTRIPSPALVTGRLEARGSGFAVDSLELEASLRAVGSRLGALRVDTVEARVRADAGLLTVDTITADLGGVRIRGGGSLGLRDERDGEARVVVRAESLAGLRPLLLGDTVIAGDTLTVLDRELLRFQGIDPDTLPDTASVAMSGRLDADLRLQGWIESFGVEGSAVLLDGVYGLNRVDSLAATFRARDLPSMAGVIEAEVSGRGLQLEDRSFERIAGRFSMEDRAGEARVEILREPGERLEAAGEFALDSAGGGGEVRLAEARLQLDSLTWETPGPSRVVWDPGSIRVEQLEIRRAGAEPMRLTADGTLAWEGESDLSIEGEGLRLGRVMRLLDAEEVELEGAVDLELSVRGPSAEPTVDGELRWLRPRWNEVTLDSLSGSLAYADRSLSVDFAAWEGAHRAFTAEGTVPVDLALDTARIRTVSRPMDVRVQADSLSASSVLSFLGFLEDVEGRVSGDFDIGGTLDAPEPRGVFRLRDAAWTMEALGVRHTEVNGSLTLNPDRTVEVELATTAAGSSEITGTVTLDPLTDPVLDLAITFDGFQAVARSDIEGRISGDLALEGSYRQPLAQGTLTVNQGTLFLEEFARSSDVVDLSDPRILEVVDTTALETRPILASVRNPFLQNLRVDIDLSVPRDTWLRSPDMNVEMGGELLVAYDRTNRDMVMVGELEALRGSYSVLGRTFEVQGGTVGFIGTPGINPTLDIEAQARLPQREGNDLTVTATVGGNLTQPRVQLSSDEQGYAESELVSYLIFGTGANELQGQQALGQAGASFAVTYLSGSLANQLGSALAREVGVDYLNVTQVGNLTSGSVAGTRIEVGQYITDDVFIVVIFTPDAETGGRGGFGGARVEWSLNAPYTVEGFVEDRLLRTGVGGFNDLGFEDSLVLGVFIFREWGY